MNRADEIREIVSTLRGVGVSDHQIAVLLGIEHTSLRWILHKYRRSGMVFPAPAAGVTHHLERAIAALVHSLSGVSKLAAPDAMLIITAHRSRLAMRDAAAKLVNHGIVEPDDVAWLLGHLGCESSDSTLAA